MLPKALQTRAVIEALGRTAGDAGIPLNRLRVGSGRNTINPRTGSPEFADPSEEPMEEITITAPRETGLVQLPQNLPKEFHVYGTPINGQGQYGVPATMNVVGAASKAWTEAGNAPFYVGNVSKADGSAFPPHDEKGGHTTGTAFDMRPIRKDGKNAGVDYTSPDYDRAARQRLVDTLRATGGVGTIYFNDPETKGVTYRGGHDNHLHAQVDPNYRRGPGR